MSTFHLEGINKDAAIALARHFGLRRDWARVKLPEIRSMLRAFGADRLIEAAKALPDFFDEEDITNLTDPEVEFAPDADEAETVEFVETKTEPERVPAAQPQQQEAPKPAMQQATATQAPDVGQAAALLTQLLSMGTNPEQIRAIVKQEVANLPARELLIKSEKVEVKIEGLQHHSFEKLLHVCAARQPDGHRLNVWLYGPPGTGKTTAARNVAKALGLDFHCNGALSTKYELTGFIDANGVCHKPEFRKAWENGGVYLFDEIDGSVPAAVVAFNAALANGVMAFPDKMIERHPDCVIIAAANTSGMGATSEFTGRMKLDMATLDRFLMIEWGIDEELETASCGNREWAKLVQAFRKKVATKGINGISITPRAAIYGASLLANGMPMEQVKELVLRKGMSQDQWAMVN